MKTPELSDFDDVIDAESEFDFKDPAVKDIYSKLSIMHGSIDFSNLDESEHNDLLMGFSYDSYELTLAEDDCMPVDKIIQLSRYAFRSILAGRQDIGRLL